MRHGEPSGPGYIPYCLLTANPLLSSLSPSKFLDQSRFATRRIVLVNNALLCCSIQEANSRGNLELSLFQVTSLNKAPRRLNTGASR